MWKKIARYIDVPVTLFLTGHVHPEEPIELTDNIQIGNHSFEHKEWYDIQDAEKAGDMMKNHEFLEEKYGITPTVYRSPHLRMSKWVDNFMKKKGYKREMECAECIWCPPMEHAHLKKYFSSHHHFGPHPCHRKFEEAFQLLCEKGKDFTFFLDPNHFETEERVESLKNLISIGKDFGEFKKL